MTWVDVLTLLGWAAAGMAVGLLILWLVLGRD